MRGGRTSNSSKEGHYAFLAAHLDCADAMALSPAQIAHGPMFIGTVLNVLLYGITIAQIYLYQNSFNRDGLYIRSFVYVLFLGDTIQTVFTVMYLYDSVILNFGNTTYLMTGDWIFSTDPALTGILGVSVLTALIILLCAASSILMGIATAVAIGMVPMFLEFQKFKVVVIIWLVSASFADMIITSSLVIYLRRHRTGFKRTDTHIDRIIRLTVQTGLITAVWAFVDLMVYLLNPTGLHLIFNFPLSKLYTNSLMSSLNARTFWQYDGDDDALVFNSNRHRPSLSLSTLKARVSVDLSTDRRRDMEVFVQVESHRKMDPLDKVDCVACHKGDIDVVSRSKDLEVV
ncbi:hypothetical protein LshimejAT787_0502210 [Lyophyllum shimeji]|uniref:DUF6534 domain-containing protein n=1 Tax=Lyophyllum shimeji TaxID=47721 RepID=A0A9P3PN55_LYOSH|nr:hypothetical protein LshimejAT787_0502210 [Lyophyllum shimeji]